MSRASHGEKIAPLGGIVGPTNHTPCYVPRIDIEPTMASYLLGQKPADDAVPRPVVKISTSSPCRLAISAPIADRSRQLRLLIDEVLKGGLRAAHGDAHHAFFLDGGQFSSRRQRGRP